MKNEGNLNNMGFVIHCTVYTLLKQYYTAVVCDGYRDSCT